MRLLMTARRAGRLLGRGNKAARLARWRLMRFAALALGAFVAFNGISGVGDDDSGIGTWLAAALVVAMGVAVWSILNRIAGERPQ